MQISLKNLTYIYGFKTPFEVCALDNITINFPTDNFIFVLGNTGSGKSTLIQFFNLLLKPFSGEIIFNHKISVNSRNFRKTKKRQFRQKHGLVFQFPENQLFAPTILGDVMYGPIQNKMPKDLAQKRAKKYLSLLGISEKLFAKDPLDLSGGQKRKVAIAGVLANDPDILIFDEPTAGLDPKSCHDLLTIFKNLSTEENKQIFIISHDIELVNKLATKILLLREGKVVFFGQKNDFFNDFNLLKKNNIVLPLEYQLINEIHKLLPKTKKFLPLSTPINQLVKKIGISEPYE